MRNGEISQHDGFMIESVTRTAFRCVHVSVVFLCVCVNFFHLNSWYSCAIYANKQQSSHWMSKRVYVCVCTRQLCV